MGIEAFFQDIKVPLAVVHVISVIFAMGSALASDILFSFYSRNKKLNSTELATLSILAKIVFYGLFAVAISGLGLFLSDVERYTHSVKFLAKMSIFAILLLNGYVLNKYIWAHLLRKNFFTGKSERNVRRAAFACGAISVVSWISAAALGVLDRVNTSYAFIMASYFLVLGIAILAALLVERRELN